MDAQNTRVHVSASHEILCTEPPPPHTHTHPPTHPPTPTVEQDLASWVRDGVAGLQSVVLYSLPELDGAIDSVPLGGLVSDSIYLVGERVKRLAGRLQKWIRLRRKEAKVCGGECVGVYAG
jgi:hypothetical protein